MIVGHEFDAVLTILPDQSVALVMREKYTGNVLNVPFRILQEFGPLMFSKNRHPSNSSGIGVVCVFVLELPTYSNDDDPRTLWSIRPRM